MSYSGKVAANLGGPFQGNLRLVGADAQKAPVAKVPARYVAALSVVVLFVVASATWLVWRGVSREPEAAYAEAFGKAGLPEE